MSKWMTRYLVDVNVWIALLYQGHEMYDRAVRWYDSLEAESAICCRLAQIGLLRALTNASIMGSEVRSMRQAWDAYQQIESDVRFAFMDEPPALGRAFRELSDLPFPAPKVWTDAYLAGFANAAGIALATFDGGIARRGDPGDILVID